MSSIVELNHISKTFRSGRALQDVTLSFEEGRIYGLIGQNGAGKTTLMRIIAGLAFPTSGNLSLFGSQDARQLEAARRKAGFLIENPALYPGLTAEQNLKIQQMLKGCDDAGERQLLLEKVNLATADHKRTRDFSLGMKQRLGIALALVDQPRLLILDEPINGLDPEGIAAIRNLLKELQAQGITILLSSHILQELMNLASDFIFMDHGEVIEQEGRQELLDRLKKHFILRTSDNAAARKALSEQYEGLALEMREDALVFEEQSGMNINTIAAVLDKRGICIREIREESMQLDEYFLGKTGRRV